ncbi:MAG: hypothetical protein ACHP8A_01350 [Terriglobales bacterium]|jgi:hypothetical protein|nr:hypothetical protein [Terriglobales bacterium]
MALQRVQRGIDMPSQSRKKKLVKILSPKDPLARDEGPRLIPLDDRLTQGTASSRTDYYLSLADKMLGIKEEP